MPFGEFLLRAVTQGLCAPIPLLAVVLILADPPWLVVATTYVALAGAGLSLVVSERLLAKRSLFGQAGSLLLVGTTFMAAAIAGEAFARNQLQARSFQAGMAAVGTVLEKALEHPGSALFLLVAGAIPFTVLGLIRLRRPGPAMEMAGGCLFTILAFLLLMLLSLVFGASFSLSIGALSLGSGVAPLTVLFALGLRLGWALRELLRRSEPRPRRRRRLRANAVKKKSSSAD